MANQLELLKATSSKPVFEVLDLSEFNPASDGKIRFRVNPSRQMWNEIQAASTANDNEAFIGLTARLLPRADDDDTPLSEDEFRQVFEGSTDTDPTFVFWLARNIYERIHKHFLAVTQSAKG